MNPQTINSSPLQRELFAIAQITSCFGIKGFVKIQPFTHTPERLRDLKSVVMGRTEDNVSVYEIDEIEFQANTIILKFVGYDDRTSVEPLVGNYLFVEKSMLAEPPEGSWFIHDIIGCKVFNDAQTFLGIVREVWKLPGNDLWEIVLEKRHVMFPANKELIREVDILARRIVIAPPDGLFEELTDEN